MSKLTITKPDFKKALNERKKSGRELLSKINSDNLNFEELDREFVRWNDYNIEFLKQSFDDPKNEYWDNYCSAGLTYFGEINRRKDGNRILTLNNYLEDKIEDLIKLENKAGLIKSKAPEIVNKNKPLSKKEVFIVHGHDNESKIKAARFVEKLNLTPIILHEQASSGKTIIEKIESYSDVGFGIVLYTPCDVGAVKKEKLDLKDRARQNVVFEHGFLIGKIGRENVCALVKSEIETPNDISGVVYIDMDKGDAWRFQLAKEMRKSGYEIDMNNLL